MGYIVHYIYIDLLGTKHKYPVQYQYTMGRDWMHYCYYLLTLHNISYHISVCYSFLHLQLFSTALCNSRRLSVCLSVRLSILAGGCLGRKGREREQKGREGMYFSAEIRDWSLPTMHNAHCTL